MYDRNKKARPAGGTAGRAAETGPASQADTTSQDHSTIQGSSGQRKISDYLCYGQENAIPRRGLEALTGLDGRTIRLMIERERRGGVPICADNTNGYYLPSSETEKTACARSMKHRAEEIRKTAEAIERAEV